MSSWFLGEALAVGLASGALGLLVRDLFVNRPLLRRRDALAQGLGLERAPSGALHGAVGPTRLEVLPRPGLVRRAFGVSTARGAPVLDAGTALPPGLRAWAREPGLSRWRTPPRTVMSGDAALDAAVALEGPADRVSAGLDPETRERLLDLVVGQGARIADGRLVIEGRRLLASPERAALIARRAGDLLLRLAHHGHPAAVARGLHARAVEDPVAGVRDRCLRRLLFHHPRSPEALALAPSAHATGDVPMQRLAAIVLGARDLGLCVGVAEDPTTPPAVCVRALHQLLAIAPRPQVLSTLFRVVHRPEPRVAAAVADALGWVGHPAAQQLLLRLARERHVRVQLAAVRALGRSASVQAVEVLRGLASDRRQRPEVRHEADVAAARIKTRLAGAEAGRLELLPEEAGALTFAAGGSRGELSLGRDAG